MTEFGSVLSRGAAPAAALSPRQVSGSVRTVRSTTVVLSLICGDVASAAIAIVAMRPLSKPDAFEQGYAQQTSIILLILIYLTLGLYTGRGPSPPERFRSRAIGSALFAAILVSEGAFTHQWQLTVTAGVAEAITLLAIGYYVECAIRSALIRLHLWGAPVLLLGRSLRSHSLAAFLIDQPSIGLTPIGFVDGPLDQCSETSNTFLPLSGAILHGNRPQDIAELVIATSARDLATITQSNHEARPGRYLLVGEESDVETLWVHTRTIGQRLGVEINNGLRFSRNRLLKRIIDLCIAVPLAGLLLPLVVVLALTIKLVDPGPAFYVQTRIGLNGKPLRVLKLRSMYNDAEQRLAAYLHDNEQARAEWRQFFKLADDPRILPTIGAFLRRASLDELPQIWNVIRGDMSLVGPRPFPAYHMNAFDADFRALRTSVLPGITGMWQISSRSDGDLQVQKRHDSFYIRNWSIWLDIYVLLETIPAVLAARGAK